MCQMIFSIPTDEQCKVTSHLKLYPAPKIPVMFNDDGIFEVPSKFLMDVALKHKDVMSSVGTYADHLQVFFKFIETLKTPSGFLRKKYDWKDVTDHHFHSFIHEKQNQGRKNKYIGHILTTVFRFYKWAEENKYIRKHVAIYHDDSTYAISAKYNENFSSWTWPYLPSNEFEFKSVPTGEHLEEAHVKAIETSNIVGERDALIMALYERTARRMDALRIRVQQIPTQEEIDEANESDKIVKITVLGKRNITRELEITPELAEEFRDYIDGQRAEIVSRVKRANKAYKDPGLVFISYNDGSPLNPTYISSRISCYLPERMSGHRIRAKGITDIVAAYDGYDAEGKPLAVRDVLLRAAEAAGWKNPMSLRSYLASSRASHRSARVHSESREKALALKESRLRKQITQYEQLKPIADAIGSGKEISAEMIEMLLNSIMEH